MIPNRRGSIYKKTNLLFKEANITKVGEREGRKDNTVDFKKEGNPKPT